MIFGRWVRQRALDAGGVREDCPLGAVALGTSGVIGFGIDNLMNVTYTLCCDRLGGLVYQNSTYNRREYGND
jgi:hypothetical protein